MDGLLLGFVARELSDTLSGARVDRVLQPEKDELHLLLRGREGSFRLLLSACANNARAHLTTETKQNPAEPPMFCMLLRKLLVGSRVASVLQIDGDRVLEITFDCVDELGERVLRVLSVEIMGRHSNIVLRGPDGRIADSIRHVGVDVSRVREVKPGLLYLPPPAQGKLDPLAADEQALRAALSAAPARLDKALAETLAGLGAQSAREIAYRLTGEESPHLDAAARERLAGPLRALLDALPSYGPPVLFVHENGEAIDVFPFAQKRLDPRFQRQVPEGPSAALDAFYRLRDRRERLLQKTASLARSIRTHIERCEKKLALHEEALASEQKCEEARIKGELLTANLHQIEKGSPFAEVYDYYTGQLRSIALDTRLSPAHNAQKYYRQYQKLRAAQRYAKEQAELARKELSVLEAQLDDLRKCEDTAELDEIRAELIRAGYLRAAHTRGKPKKPAPSRPMRFVSSDGIRIQVGRNSAQNDRLTAAAPGEALWLHAKNMAGSHVIVGKEGDVPERTLREAALLAAFYSQGYRSAQVPVDYTLRKHVRKPAGAPAGFVLYTNQRTLYVTPDEQSVKKLADTSHD